MYFTALFVELTVFVFIRLGIPFDDPVNWRLQIAENAQEILGDNLLGLQAGNEPDFYQLYMPPICKVGFF